MSEAAKFFCIERDLPEVIITNFMSNTHMFKHYKRPFLYAFNKYHIDNKHIQKAFNRLAQDAVDRGKLHYSASMIFNVIRWESDLAGLRDEYYEHDKDYKLNARFISLYPRLFAWENEEYRKLFSFRKPVSHNMPRLQNVVY
jgi:hypothetical protein